MPPEAWPITTADLCDSLAERAEIIALAWRSFGASASFRGPAATFRAEDDTVLIRAMLEEAGDGRVLVIDNGGRQRHALFGDRFAALMQANGWAAAVTYGALRDTAQLAKMPIGCIALGTPPRRPNKAGAGQRSATLTIAGVTIKPGYWITLDPDGLVVLPVE